MNRKICIDWTHRIIPSKEESAYIAGIIDGEGCIDITCGEKRKYPQHALRISVGSTSLEMVQFLSKFYPANIKLRMPKGNSKKPLWIWCIVTKKAAVCLKEILPYLITKREQALIGIEFQEEIKNYQFVGPTSRKRIPSGEWAFRSEMRNRMIALRRGEDFVLGKNFGSQIQCRNTGQLELLPS